MDYSSEFRAEEDESISEIISLLKLSYLYHQNLSISLFGCRNEVKRIFTDATETEKTSHSYN